MTDTAHGLDAASVHYRLVREKLLDGSIGGGSLLLETKLSQEFGVSRTPIRAALLRLEQEGLLTREARGFRVQHGSVDDIVDIYHIRIRLESLAAALAADVRSELDLTRLDALIAETRRTDDAAMHKRLDGQFHRLLWQASRNDTLIELLDRLTAKLTVYGTAMLGSPGNSETTVDEHAAVVDALRARDPGAAEAAITRHLTRLRDLRIAALLDG